MMVGIADADMDASPPGNGRRGLKQKKYSRHGGMVSASPPGNGRRGLKHVKSGSNKVKAGGIASRKREAWIETGPRRLGWMSGFRASPPGNGRRGLKPFGASNTADPTASIASRKREAWIETYSVRHPCDGEIASPPGNGRRGLKRRNVVFCQLGAEASPPGNGRRGLKHRVIRHQRRPVRCIASRKREAWIETRVQAVESGTIGTHRLPETGGVD